MYVPNKTLTKKLLYIKHCKVYKVLCTTGIYCSVVYNTVYMYLIVGRGYSSVLLLPLLVPITVLYCTVPNCIKCITLTMVYNESPWSPLSEALSIGQQNFSSIHYYSIMALFKYSIVQYSTVVT